MVINDCWDGMVVIDYRDGMVNNDWCTAWSEILAVTL